MSSNKISPALVFVLVASVSLLAGSPAKAAVTKITTCPFDITVAGHYVVVQDLFCPTVGIAIFASDVDLNVGGHTITGSPGSSEGIFVDVVTNVHIRNGTVTGYSGPGIFLSGSRILVEAMTLTGNGDGLAAVSSDNNIINSSNISDNTFVGIEGVDVNGNTFAGNKVIGNGAAGYALEFGSNNNVITSSKISSSVIAGNQTYGVFVSGGSNNTVRSSQVLSNLADGIVVTPGTTGTQILANTVNGNNRGIVLDSGATGSTVKSNTAKNNTVFDMEDDNGPTCDTNVWLHNNFNTANQPCIH